MASQKPQEFNPPNSPPPPAYGSAPGQFQNIPPQPTGASTDYYGASPAPQFAHPQHPQNAYYPPGPNDPSQQYYGQPPMGYNQQGQNPYGPQGYYAGPQQGYYGPNGQQGYYGQPQGQYIDQRGNRGGPGFMEACLGALACCCCLELLF
ncbi:hypothetical protein BGZ60DRAFT_567964 [Tricladium varicosporioides]|nr:hypothetical protein BGZ60DRAFT_567964 [Hymenoscyphus varicosporioides]